MNPDNRALLQLAFGDGYRWYARAARCLGTSPKCVVEIAGGRMHLTRYHRRAISHYCRQHRATLTSIIKRRELAARRQAEKEAAAMAQAELMCRALDAEMERHEKNKRK